MVIGTSLIVRVTALVVKTTSSRERRNYQTVNTTSTTSLTYPMSQLVSGKAHGASGRVRSGALCWKAVGLLVGDGLCWSGPGVGVLGQRWSGIGFGALVVGGRDSFHW
jgi:hypothetical protein